MTDPFEALRRTRDAAPPRPAFVAELADRLRVELGIREGDEATVMMRTAMGDMPVQGRRSQRPPRRHRGSGLRGARERAVAARGGSRARRAGAAPRRGPVRSQRLRGLPDQARLQPPGQVARLRPAHRGRACPRRGGRAARAQLPAHGGAGDQPRTRGERAGPPLRRGVLLRAAAPAAAAVAQHAVGDRRLHGRQRRHAHRAREHALGRRPARPVRRARAARDAGGLGRHLPGHVVARRRREHDRPVPARRLDPVRRGLGPSAGELPARRPARDGEGRVTAPAPAPRLQHPPARSWATSTAATPRRPWAS